ncbi:MAG: S41 family peptidase, partial [Bryobacteraceae bacterium]
VWQTVRDTHWEEKPGGGDWNAVRTTLRPEMEKTATMDEARAVLRRMLGTLKQSHFGILPGDVYSAVDEKRPDESAPGGMMGEGRTGIDLRVVGDQVLVTSVDEGSTASKAGVRPGWQILRIDGQELTLAVRKVNEAYKDSTVREMLLSRAILSRLSGSVGQNAKVEFRDGAGRASEMAIEYGPPRGTRSRFGHLPPQYVWFNSRRLDKNVGYVAFNLFLDPARLMPAFEAAVKSFATADGMVIDLRGNPGGIGIMAMGIAGWFIDRADLPLGTMYMKGTPLRFVVNPRHPNYRGPLAVLIDGASASTSEILAGGLKDIGRARIFGTRSAGAALPSAIERLPNGDGFQYALANYISEGGKPLEGIGVIPDEEARPSREALLDGRDAALEAALRWIRSR